MLSLSGAREVLDSETPRFHHAARRRAAAWPLAARAQRRKAADHRVLGRSTPSAWSQWVAAFVQRLRELGWIEGRTIAIEYRWAEGRSERFAEIAAEFVRLKVDVIVTAGAAVLAAKQATSVIPIVFAVADDPVGSGLVASLARPGGNVTGLSLQSADIAGKRLELLREVVPRSAPVGDHGQCRPCLRACWRWARFRQRPARSASRSIAFEIRRAEDIAPAFEALKGRADALYVCRRPARDRQPNSHQHLGAGRAAADDARHFASTSKREV